MERLITFVIKMILSVICKVDKEEIKNIPEEGPLLLIFNHINFLEVPIIYLSLQPRKVGAIVKKENWDNWFFRILSNAWGGIPVDREKPKKSTFKEAEKVLKDKKILCIAPEGTRSETGELGEGHLGVVFIALRNQVPIYPMVHYGAEKFWHNIKRFKRTQITFKVGTPFMLASETRATKEIQHEMGNQIMIRLAAMLPEKYRGVYKNLNIISNEYIKDLSQSDVDGK